MDTITRFLEKYLLPVADTLGKNRYLLAIKDAFLITLPFTMFGSLFTVLVNLPFLTYLISDEKIQHFQDLISPTVTLTTGITALLVAAGIGYSLSTYYKVNPIYGALTSLSAFLMVTPITMTTESKEVVTNVFPISELGAVGMFTAIIVAFTATEFYRLAIHKNWTISMPSSVPKLVSDSFFSFIPVSLALLVAFIIRTLFSFTSFNSLNSFIYQMLQTPLENIGSTLIATVFAAMLVNIFWFFGLHGHSIALSIIAPIWQVKSLENLQAFQAGKEIPNLISESFTNFFAVNGGYISIPLLLCLLIFLKKKKDWQQLGKIALVPGLFGVYEPLIFGLPVMLNAVLFIPLMLTPVITTTLSYAAMASGLVPYATGVALPYTMPLIISGAIVTNSLRGALLQLVNLIILTAMWYVFMKVLYNQSIKKEGQKNETN